MAHSDNSPIKIRCNCTSEFQDSEYGKGIRLHNPGKADDTWRCTVCGTTIKYTPPKHS